jgi:hypothetical protein
MFNRTSPFATHQPLLAWAIEVTDGPILELGCGECSTQFILDLVDSTGRRVVSAESSRKWFDDYKHTASDDHTMVFVEDWFQAVLEFEKQPWSVVLVDCDGPREWLAKTLVRVSDFVIVHDSDHHYLPSNAYGWMEHFPPNPPDPKRKGPPTIILSKTHSLHCVDLDEGSNT